MNNYWPKSPNLSLFAWSMVHFTSETDSAVWLIGNDFSDDLNCSEVNKTCFSKNQKYFIGTTWFENKYSSEIIPAAASCCRPSCNRWTVPSFDCCSWESAPWCRLLRHIHSANAASAQLSRANRSRLCESAWRRRAAFSKTVESIASALKRTESSWRNAVGER